MRTLSKCVAACLWLCLSLGLVAACATDEDTPEAIASPQDTSGLAIRIGAPTASFSAREAAWIDVAYVNESSEPIRVLAWTLPSSDLWEDLFAVTVDGVRARYIGRVYRRPAPREKDYVVLPPGQSLSGRVELSRLYDLSRTATYEVRAQASLAALTGVDDPDAAAIASNPVRVFAEGRPQALAPDDIFAYYGISFTSCASWQKDDLRVGMDWADSAASEASDFLASSSNRNHPRYRRWFGAYSSSRWSRARSVFDTMRQRFANNRIRFNCACDDDYYAYVYPDRPYNIYICNVYWDASLEDKGGTVIHEMSHFNAVGSTDDAAYGVSACESLARNQPNAAVQNADNYAYFVELPD